MSTSVSTAAVYGRASRDPTPDRPPGGGVTMVRQARGLSLVVVADSRPAASAHQAAAIFVVKGEQSTLRQHG